MAGAWVDGEGTVLSHLEFLSGRDLQGPKVASSTFTVSDGVTTSAPATVTLVVGEEPPPPGGCGCAAGSSGGAFGAGLLLALLGLLRRRPAVHRRVHGV